MITYDLNNSTADIVCNTLQYDDITESFIRCVENDLQLLEWIRTTDFAPSEELDAKLSEIRENISKYYLKALIGINEFGVKNVFNRGLGYKIMLTNDLVELLRKYKENI